MVFSALRSWRLRASIALVGALAVAHRARRPASFEDLYALLLPGREDSRQAAFDACARIPDLDQAAEFFRREPVSRSGADIPCAHNRNLLSRTHFV